jgi:predicted ArsR family transcriptional regulator
MFDDRVVAEYLRRSYFAADGLWFMKVEERLGFDEALRLDVEVWSILAKIQARKARELLGVEGGSLADLVEALGLRFTAEDYGFTVAGETPGRAEIAISGCPWVELLRKSGRQELAARVADAICPTDLGTWAREFDPAITVSFPERICDGCGTCRVVLEAPV